MLRVGFTHQRHDARPHALRGAVALLFAGIRAVYLDEHGVVYIAAERVFHGIQVWLVPVGRQLYAMTETAREILNEFGSGSAVARSNHPARDKLRVRINRGPRPHATDSELILLFDGYVLVLRANERPDFIALKTAAREVSEITVLILRTCRADLNQQLRDRVLRNARESHGGADRVSFDEAPDYHHAAGVIEPVHIDHYA